MLLLSLLMMENGIQPWGWMFDDSVLIVHPALLEKLPSFWKSIAERSHSRHHSMCFPMFGDPLFEELFVFEPL